MKNEFYSQDYGSGQITTLRENMTGARFDQMNIGRAFILFKYIQ
jgi:hypothetical protein